ncbi:unnamed protein product, partial [Rotaria magnacalcarata]
IFTFIWFWYMMVFIVSIFDVIAWVTRFLPSKQYNYIKRRLQLMKRDTEFNNYPPEFIKRYYMQFIFGYLEPDGLFMLRLLSSNTSDFVCTEVINQLWQRFYKKDTKRTKRNRKPESNSQQIAQERKHQIANTTETRDSIRCRSLKATSIPIQTNNGHDVLLRSRKSSFQPLVEDNV